MLRLLVSGEGVSAAVSGDCYSGLDAISGPITNDRKTNSDQGEKERKRENVEEKAHPCFEPGCASLCGEFPSKL